MHFSFLSGALLALSGALHVSAAPISEKVLRPQHASFDTIVSELKSAEVIPDVLPSTFSPTVSLSLTYTTSHTNVELGNTIPVPKTSSRPVFQLTPLSSPSTLSPTRTLSANKTYTLVMSDPDATSRSDPVMGQMCHWIATGIQLAGTNETEGLEQGDMGVGLELRGLARVGGGATKGAGKGEVGEWDVEELVKYMQPGPPPKTGKHRYVFVLLEPEEGEGGGKSELKTPKERPHFGYGKVGKGVMDWAEDNGLKPVGANFFYAKNEKQ